MIKSYMVRFFSDSKQIYERRTDDPMEAKSLYDQFPGYCRDNKLQTGSAVLYDYVRFAWRPLMITAFIGGQVERFDILRVVGGDGGDNI